MSNDSLSFSERLGITKSIKDIQIDSIDNELKNGLWNCLSKNYWSVLKTHYLVTDISIPVSSFIISLWEDYFKSVIDEMPRNTSDIYTVLKSYFFKSDWYDIYNLIEFVIKKFEVSKNMKEDFVKCANKILEREFSGYRIVGDTVTKITSHDEIVEVNTAMNSPLKTVNEHFKTALSHLADKTNPDYRNSIKESISAVESICKKIVGRDDTTLGNALTQIQKSGDIQIHEDMNEAFRKFYGYTSDAGGIRHALMDGKINPDFDDAKFMLVSCSAFVNYLISKATKAGITLK